MIFAICLALRVVVVMRMGGYVCVNGSKRKWVFLSPADAIPQGDNVDIDYVLCNWKSGHQAGATHTFSMSLHGPGVTKK